MDQSHVQGRTITELFELKIFSLFTKDNTKSASSKDVPVSA